MKIKIILLSLVFCCISFASFASDALNESLIYHVYFGESPEVERLLERGANPDIKDEHGWPVLAIAIDRGDEQAFPIAKALVEAGANVNAAKSRSYPLILAITNHNVPLVSLLVGHDANLLVKHPDGLPASAYARKLGNKKIIQIIEKELFEQQQTQTWLRSSQHLQQITRQYSFHHCAFQYWGFYYRSKQDKEMDVAKIKRKMRFHANRASEVGRKALRYFPDTYNKNFDKMASYERDKISKQLNDMISNRNRRQKGVGEKSDMLERCGINDAPEHYRTLMLVGEE